VTWFLVGALLGLGVSAAIVGLVLTLRELS
jgi:hypothetical protein